MSKPHQPQKICKIKIKPMPNFPHLTHHFHCNFHVFISFTRDQIFGLHAGKLSVCLYAYLREYIQQNECTAPTFLY